MREIFGDKTGPNPFLTTQAEIVMLKSGRSPFQAIEPLRTVHMSR